MSTFLSFFGNPVVYKILSYATALLYFYLFVTLLFSPASFLAGVGLAGSESAFILARRAAMLMLGFAVLAFFGAGVPASAARQALTLAICVNMAGFATMSLVEYFRGTVNSSILQAAAIEAFLAVAYFLIWLAGRILPPAGGLQ
jgi:hypothetical protein